MAARLTPSYNCVHFLRDAWLAETGRDIGQLLTGFMVERTERRADQGLAHAFVRLGSPVGPCVVLWRRRGVAPHVGLYVRRHVLHLTDSGPIRQLVAVASLGYHTTRFYAPR